MTIKISACVITYHPDILVLDANIQTYLPFVEALYIIDNTPSLHKHLESITRLSPKISIVYNHTNLGIAKGLNIAIELALKNNFEWLLTMDQDSSFYDCSFYIDCFTKLNQKENIAVTSTNIDYKSLEHFCTVQKKDRLITSGSLLNLPLSKNIGGFDENLFIDEVDFDYCLKAKILGYDVIMFTHIPLNHTVGTKKITGKKAITEHNAQRVYYMTRNRLYMASKYHKLFPEYYSYRKIIKEAIYRKFKQIIKYESNKWEKLKSLYLGIKHFFQNKYGALK